MTTKKIHVYLMPGMAAKSSIFKHIELPHDRFETHLLEWFVPSKGMSLEAYAKKMNSYIKHADPVLIGVSFGGMLVQEMAKHIAVKKVVIISSVKLQSEMPKRLVFAKYTRFHKLLPTSLVNNLDLIAKYAFGETVTQRLELYREYLFVKDIYYLDWSIDQIVHWKQDQCDPRIVHIHGDKDVVFPIHHIKNCITVKNGTHTMIIHRYKWFNERLPAIILE
ncbi:alpha/beta hydrolase [uncultured Muriicola sp.]|uniref:alpha/beta fold hydrolase n=1 Tax=uncultured Muriicola sp. TaxID=1583102 RepID=UPI002610D163|nr:alpha/beta hydrolase [uncultured Muriicola sp.]